MDVDSHLEAAYEERHEIDLSYDDRYHPELAGEDIDLDEEYDRLCDEGMDGPIQ